MISESATKFDELKELVVGIKSQMGLAVAKLDGMETLCSLTFVILLIHFVWLRYSTIDRGQHGFDEEIHGRGRGEFGGFKGNS